MPDFCPLAVPIEELFAPIWLFFVPSLLIGLFLILSLATALLKKKFQNKNVAIFASSGTALFLSILNLCTVCLLPTFGFFGIFLQFPPPIVSFLFGMSAITISNLIIDHLNKKNIDFAFKEFIITIGLVTITLTILYLSYLWA